ncbi:MAG TPA: hypothetical protein VKP65_16955 [Rhodothermales bacterium]|nr:hypothetical protein [Rhodothermales bacterium]
MTARTLLERAGCLAADLARRAGIDPNTWNKMLTRDTPLTTARSPKRGKRIANAARDIRAELTQIIRDLEKDHG